MINTDNNALKNIYVSKIKPISWTIIIIIWILCIYAIWQSILPFLAERRYRDGYNFSMAKRYQYAIEEIELAVKYAPFETHYMVQLGKDYDAYAKAIKNKTLKLKYFNKAADIFKKCMDYDVLNPWYKNRLANVYLELAKLSINDKETINYNKKAEELIRAAATVDSNNPLFLLNLAYFLHRNGKTNEAEVLYDKIINIDGNILEARYNLGFLYRNKQLNGKALEQYLAIHKRKPHYSNIRLAIASLYIILKQNEKAIPFLEEKIKVDSTNIEAMKNLAAIYIQVQNWQKATELYERLFKLYPGERTASHQYYIQALANSNRINLALKKINDFLNEFPGNKSALNQREKLLKIAKDRPELLK